MGYILLCYLLKDEPSFLPVVKLEAEQLVTGKMASVGGAVVKVIK
jgi:hypothetical protein